MSTIFIAAPISGFNDQKEYVNYRKSVINLIACLEDEYQIFSELTKVKEICDYDTPEEAVKQDLELIDNADFFIILHPYRMQTSSMIELGYALANKKNIIIIGKIEDLPYMAVGMRAFSNVRIVSTNELSQNTVDEILKEIESGF